MKISINYLKKYLGSDLPPYEELIEKIGSQLGAIDERVINLGEIYRQVTVAKIVKCQPMAGSDHLSICLIDDGHKFSDGSIRQSDGLIQVVCGAPNVAAGQLVAWLPPTSIVPNTFFKDKLTLTSKTLQGNISHGMIASSMELMIDDDHDGILVIDKPATPGDSFAALYDLNDYVIDIENKMFTHRPDCFGLMGIARELAGILNKPFTSPSWYLREPKFEPSSKDHGLEIDNEIPSLVPRFSAISLSNLVVQPSPIQTRSYLSRMGIRPINSIVDATNLAMLETGQPLHAYDYAKLKELSDSDGVKITIRNPKNNESISLINDKKVTPGSDAIVIAANQPIGLGGVMGAESSAITGQTTSIVLESACFDMYSIRRTSMGLGLFSDAVTRFNKGQSPLQTTRVLAKTIDLIKELCGADVTISSDLVDNNNLPESTIERDSLHPDIKIEEEYINQRLGTSLSVDNMASLLKNVECQVETTANSINIKAPFWRTDIEIREDVVEEVGRLYGYDHITLADLKRSIKPVVANSRLELKARLRETLLGAGANEALTYSFVSKKLLEACSQDAVKAYQLANPLSPDVEYYRLSLIPSLLSKVNSNIRAGYQTFSIFELGAYHLIEGATPSDHSSLALVFASNSANPEPSYYQAKAFLAFCLSSLGVASVTYQRLSDNLSDLPPHLAQAARPFDANRSAVVVSNNGEAAGIVGEFKPETRRLLKLPVGCSGFEVNLDLFDQPKQAAIYNRLSKYPAVKQDMTLKLPTASTYQELTDFITLELRQRLGENGFAILEVISVYQAKDATDYVNYTFRISVNDYTKTLKDPEVNELLDQVAAQANAKLKAVRI